MVQRTSVVIVFAGVWLLTITVAVNPQTETSNNDIELSDEGQLIADMLKRRQVIGRNGRPKKNSSEPIHIYFGLALVQMELDEKRKMLKTSMWSKYIWRDEYMTWSPGKYGGLSKVRLQSNLLWTPDIMLYNTADTEKSLRDALALIQADGTVIWYPQEIFRSSCSIDVTQFPFDSQTCHLWFGSWTYDKNSVQLHLLNNDSIRLHIFNNDYKETSMWQIISSTSGKKVLPENDTDAFNILTYTLQLRRKVVFSSYILTLPCIFLACLTLAVFWLPPDRPDRTSLSMSIFSSFLVLLLILVEAAPPTASSIPLLGIYYCFNMVIIMLSIFLSSLVVNVSRIGQDSSRRVPACLYRVMEFTSRLLCLQGRLVENVKRRHKTKANDLRDESHKCLISFDSTTEQHINLTGHEKHILYNKIAEIRWTLKQILTFMVEKNRKEMDYREIVSEWRTLALMLDRIFFFLYLILIILSLIILFPRP